MGIVFFCQSCGARFEVDSRMAGKKGRCRKCGQYTTIPRAEEIASLTALPALATAAAAAAAPAAHSPPPPAAPIARLDDAPSPSVASWLKAGLSQVGLAPLTLDLRTPPDQAVRARRRGGLQTLCAGQAPGRDSGPGADEGFLPPAALEARARRRPEGLPLAQRERLFRLDPVHPHPPVRDGGEEPPHRAVRGGLRGPAQPGPDRRGRGRPRRRPVTRRLRSQEAQAAGPTRGRASPDDRPGGPGVHLHPLARERPARPGERPRPHPPEAVGIEKAIRGQVELGR